MQGQMEVNNTVFPQSCFGPAQNGWPNASSWLRGLHQEPLSAVTHTK